MLYISLTLLPSRIDNLKDCIPTLINQTKRPDKIIINCPELCFRTNEKYDLDKIRNIINDIESSNNSKNIIYLNITKDYGPITKIFPLIYLEFIKDNDEIIVVDDDKCYNKFLIEALYNCFINHNNYSIGFSGIYYPPKSKKCVITKPGRDTDILEASFGYIIKRSFIQNDLERYVLDINYDSYKGLANRLPSIFLSDDLVISRYLDYKGIKKKVINTNLVNKNSATTHLKSQDSLCVINSPMERYHKAFIEMAEINEN